MIDKPVRRKRLRRVTALALATLAFYLLAAYVFLPWRWTSYERARSGVPTAMVTRTAEGIPGDPINVSLVGSEADVLRAMHAAGWSAADPVTWKTSLEIIGSVVFDRPFRHAPVSPLFIDGRREDLAFETPVGVSADRRRHVRFWKTPDLRDGRPVWIGSVTFDRGVGFSRLTGAVTHHIAPDVDAERTFLGASLRATGLVSQSRDLSGAPSPPGARNGEGDPYQTDGNVLQLVLRATAPP